MVLDPRAGIDEVGEAHRVALGEAEVGEALDLVHEVVGHLAMEQSPEFAKAIDLVQRLKLNAPLNTPNPKTFYVPGPAGYIDYPTLP